MNVGVKLIERLLQLWVVAQVRADLDPVARRRLDVVAVSPDVRQILVRQTGLEAEQQHPRDGQRHRQ
jgi:hypothetical protein